MDALIAPIEERVADPLRAVDAASWVVPMPTVSPPATAAEVDAALPALDLDAKDLAALAGEVQDHRQAGRYRR